MSQLTEKQNQAARLIALGFDYTDISKEIGVGRATLYRWRKKTEFDCLVSELLTASQQQNHQALIRDIDQINELVLSTLQDVAINDSSGSARVAAAKALSDLVVRAEERASEKDSVMIDQSSEIKKLIAKIANNPFPTSSE